MFSSRARAALATLTVLALAACSPREAAKPDASSGPHEATVTPAQRARLRFLVIRPSQFHKTIETTGTVGFDNDRATTVIAAISGPVSRIVVALGSHVQAGDPLAYIDSPDYASAISGYRKAVVTAKNLARIADLDKQLFDADAIARRDVEQAQTDSVNAAADRDAALQQLRSIGVPEEAIKDIQEDRPITGVAGIIRAPLSGTVVEKLITPRQLIQAGTTPCFTVADLSQMWVEADIFEAQLASVTLGDAAEVVTSASTDSFPGVVDNISAIIDPNTRSIAIRVVAKNPGEVLKKQMYVRVLIHSKKESTGLLAPVSAILRDDQNLPFVYKTQPGGTFARRPVTLGSRVGDAYEITAGLNEGDEIVVDGGLFVQFQENQ